MLLCVGCGLELSPGAGRGRPALFHHATCRQRARRARLSSKHTTILAVIAASEAAASELRPIALAGDTLSSDASHSLEQAAAELAHQLCDAPVAAPSMPEALFSVTADPIEVTKNVTIKLTVSAGAATGTPQVTQSLTKEPDSPAQPAVLADVVYAMHGVERMHTSTLPLRPLPRSLTDGDR